MSETKREPKDRAIAAKAVAIGQLRDLYKLSGKDAPVDATMLEMLSDGVITNAIADGDILHVLHYIRILGTNAEHGEKVKRTEADHAELCLGAFSTFMQMKREGGFWTKPGYLTEAKTRKLYIDAYLKEAGWDVLETEHQAIAGKAGIEIEVKGMPNPTETGFCDYVLYGNDGKPLAVVEAKKTSVNAEVGRHQVELYGNCLKEQYGYVPILYYTNGYEIRCIDGLYPDARTLSSFHTLKELERMIQRRDRGNIADTRVNESIAGRPYQQIAIRNVCERFNKNFRRALLVMATGTGKTRVACALTELLQRNKWVKNVLFLADRTSLVGQAKRAFTKMLPDQTFCELSSSDPEKDFEARMMFSTYQTMINYVDGEKKKFGIGRFDLVIIDEAHRSVFNKYGAIFNYFDSLLVGLTATPRGEVEKSTYQLFACENGVPNYEYTLQEAVDDHWLVPYKVSSHTTKVMQEGVKYADLSEDERKKVEDAYGDEPPEVLPSSDLFKRLFNTNTCDLVLENLMENGLKVAGGDKLGKSIIFAYNHKHAQLIVDRFKEIYPMFPNACRLIDNQVKYADDLILKFDSEDDFRIAVSVDMLDTGIDVPAVTNLVFFKPVKSKIKFVQMIGRGTRLCEGLGVLGQKSGDKEWFKIFDYCGNFAYFGQNPAEDSDARQMTLTERLYNLRVAVAFELQKVEHQHDMWKAGYHGKLVDSLYGELLKIREQRNRIVVRNAMPHVDNFRNQGDWLALTPIQVKEIELHIAPLMTAGEGEDDTAKIFDARMLKIEIAVLAAGDVNGAAKDVQFVREAAVKLLQKASVPAVHAKMDLLEKVAAEQFWREPHVKNLEEVREELRDLIKFLDRGKGGSATVSVEDVIEDGEPIPTGIIDIRSYRQKVIDYLAEHADIPVVRKIKNLEKVNEDDLRELERILWFELGTKNDYLNTTDIRNLAAFVRSVVGIEQRAVNEKFGKYLNGSALTVEQQEFLKTIIDYVRENGDISKTDLLEVAPFNEYNILAVFGESVPVVNDIVSTLENVIAAPEGFFDLPEPNVAI